MEDHDRSGGGAATELIHRPMEERHVEWGYSRPVVALDVVWNMAFVLVSAAVLLSTAGERPGKPVRAWIFGYAMQCLIHVGFVCFEYRRRRRRGRRGRWERRRWVEDVEEEDEEMVELDESWKSRTVKKLESLNAIISFFWWILGFYWIFIGGQDLLQDAPRLYWLAVVFLAFDVFFAIFCTLLACVIGIALCCCLPCILMFLYAVAGQEGASDADLSTLPRFHFRQAIRSQEYDFDRDQVVAITVNEPDTCNTVADLPLSPEDSECCICLTHYEDGAELHSLPCNHHFHSGCIVKWLRINATCPLCKYNIIRGDEHV